MNVFKELYQNRKLIWKLSKNDFRNKFAGAYFGIIWAFIQPMVTVAVYFVVFQLGLRVQPAATGYPYICWLVSGIIPWFFFSDALPSASNCLLEYSYLVKKVVFQIDALPVVKLISALFTHAFFVVFMLVVFAVMGFYPDLYVLQVVYYSFCMVTFTAGLIYATSAVTVFFRDMKEVVAILLQIGMWVTPIMWNFESMQGIPKWAVVLLKLNPMYYIVSGYRDALINKTAFWEHPGLTLWFWGITLFTLWAGTTVFKRLRVHFADVL